MFKRKIKKWHIVLLLVVGVGGYLMSQNMWVFEKEVAVEDFQMNIENTIWVDTEGVFWVFNDGNYSRHSVEYVGIMSYYGAYQVKNNYILVDAVRDYNNSHVFLDYQIKFLSKDHMMLVLNRIHEQTYKLKKNINEKVI